MLHQLNTFEAERLVFASEKRNLPDSAFVNNKLTAKLTRQLEEPMIVARQVILYDTSALILTIPTSVPVFRTGLWIYLNISPSYSRLLLATTSSSQLLLDMLVLFSSGKANRAVPKTTIDGMKGLVSLGGFNGRKSGSHANTFWSLQSRSSNYMARRLQCSRLNISKK